MTVTNEKINQILKVISEMSLLEIVELTKEMKEQFGIIDVAPVVVAAAGGAAQAAAVEEQTEFKVIMTSFGDNKINVIKVVRAITGLGLKEAKDMVEAVPAIVKEGISKADAESIKKQLVEAGASVEIK